MGARARAIRFAVVALVLALCLGLSATAFAASTYYDQLPAPGSTTAETKPLIQVKVSDPAGISTGYQLKVDGVSRTPKVTWGPNASYCVLSYQYTSPLASGTHTVYASVFTGAGRTSTTWTFTVGQVAPIITSFSPADGTMVSTKTPTVTATVLNTPIASAQVEVDGQLVPSTLSLGTVSAPTSLTNDSQHTARVTLVGVNGLVATRTSTFYVLQKMQAPSTLACTDCHTTYPLAHPVDNCAACHGEGSPVGGGYTDPAQSHAPGTSCSQCHLSLNDCTRCHGAGYSTVPPLHSYADDSYHISSSTGCSGDGCHSRRLTIAHDYPGRTCAMCHGEDAPADAQAAVAAGDTACTACHGGSTGGHLAQHASILDVECAQCHDSNLVTEHVTNQMLSCGACHDSTDPDVVNAIATGDKACTACHGAGAGSDHYSRHEPVTVPAECSGSGCHAGTNLIPIHNSMPCSNCHSSSDPNVQAAIEAGDTSCTSCHVDLNHTALHEPVTVPAECSGSGCHAGTNLIPIHNSMPCSNCHSSSDPNVQAAIAAGDKECSSCHPGLDHTSLHDSTLSADCSGCHDSNLVTGHVDDYGLTCATCHASTDEAVIAAIAAGDKACTACHGSDAGNHKPLHDSTLAAECTSCHASNLVDTHEALSCATCHSSTNPDVIAAIAAGNKDCTACHGADAGDHRPLHDQTLSADCSACHQGNVVDEHEAHSLDCATCHSSTDPAVIAAIANGDLACTACHGADAGDHTALHDVTLGGCAECHAQNLVTEHDNRSVECAGCHSSTDPAVVAAIANGVKDCSACHDMAAHPYPSAIHQANVANVPIAGPITDTNGTQYEFYGYQQSYSGQKCGECHLMDLSAEHSKTSSSVSAQACAACHSSPRDSFTDWNQTCQQGGCHVAYHQDMAVKHNASYPTDTTYGCGQLSADCHVDYWPIGSLAAVHDYVSYTGTVFVGTSDAPDGCKFCHTSNAYVPPTTSSCRTCHVNRHSAATRP